MSEGTNIPAPALPAELVTIVQAIADAIANRPAIEPEGLGNREAAEYCGCSVSLWNSLNCRGLIPAPAELSERRPVWSRTELRAWIIAGCPARARWNLMREALIRKLGTAA